MDERITPEMQLLIELVDSPQWEQLVREQRAYSASLRARALQPATQPMDFYAKEGAARAAGELENFIFLIEDTVHKAISST